MGHPTAAAVAPIPFASSALPENCIPSADQPPLLDVSKVVGETFVVVVVVVAAAAAGLAESDHRVHWTKHRSDQRSGVDRQAVDSTAGVSFPTFERSKAHILKLEQQAAL